MGVNEPDYGHLLDDMQYFEGTPIDFSALCIPASRWRSGFILGEDLPGEGCTNDDVIAAIEWGRPVDRADRLAHQGLEDHPAGHDRRQRASSCGWILGQEREDRRHRHPEFIDATLTRNGGHRGGNSSQSWGIPQRGCRGQQGVVVRRAAAQGRRDRPAPPPVPSTSPWATTSWPSSPDSAASGCFELNPILPNGIQTQKEPRT